MAHLGRFLSFAVLFGFVTAGLHTRTGKKDILLHLKLLECVKHLKHWSSCLHGPHSCCVYLRHFGHFSVYIVKQRLNPNIPVKIFPRARIKCSHQTPRRERRLAHRAERWEKEQGARDHLAARVANAVFIPLNVAAVLLLHIVFCCCLIYCIDTLEQKECLIYLVIPLCQKWDCLLIWRCLG